MARLEINEEILALHESHKRFALRFYEPLFLISDNAASVAADCFQWDSTTIQKPLQWRLNAWSYLLKAALKKVDISTDHTEYLSGLFLGLIHLGVLTIDSMPERATGESWEEWIEGATKSTMIEIREDPEKIARFHEGYNDGLSKILKKGEDGVYRYAHYTDATMLYELMLRLADYLDTLDSVNEAYEVMEFYSGIMHFSHSIESFKKLCYRIGFKGKIHREKEASMDRC